MTTLVAFLVLILAPLSALAAQAPQVTDPALLRLVEQVAVLGSSVLGVLALRATKRFPKWSWGPLAAGLGILVPLLPAVQGISPTEVGLTDGALLGLAGAGTWSAAIKHLAKAANKAAPAGKK